MNVKKVTYYQNETGQLFEKVSPSKALDTDGVQKAIEGEGTAVKKFFVVPANVPAAAK